MNNSHMFKAAHALTKATICNGDSYQATFGQCLKAVIQQNKEQAEYIAKATAQRYIDTHKSYAELKNKDNKQRIVFNPEPVMPLAYVFVCIFFLVVFLSVPVLAVASWLFGFTMPLNAHNGALLMIEAVKVGSAFGIASLLLAGLYSVLGWGTSNDYTMEEA